MPKLSAPKTPTALGILSDLPCLQIRISLYEAGLLVSALEARAEAAFKAGDAGRHHHLSDRAAKLHTTTVAKTERIPAGLRAKQAPRGRKRA